MTTRDMRTDPYHINEIDFLDAEWMRSHKFNPLSVKAARQARAVVLAREAIDKAYQDLEIAIESLRGTCELVRQKREANNVV